MRKKELYQKVIAYFEQAMPVAETELDYSNPFELLVAVILSAQCTDKRVNMITPALFRDFPTPEALAASTPEIVFEYIRSVSYPNNKAKRGTRVVGRLDQTAGCRPEDGQCHSKRGVQQGCHGRGYACIQSEPSYRTGSCQLYDPAIYREILDEVYP